MHIQWFPGHMNKALKMMESNIKVIDSVIYVLDARAIDACFNYRFDKLLGNRPILYVINKCDMVQSYDLDRWIKYFEDNNMNYVLSNSISNKYVNTIISKLIEINKDLITRYQEKGVLRSIRALVIGVPNTGKSTLINSLSKGKKTITGNRPGVTKGKQWISIDKRIDLLDTPGTMSPNIKDQEKALYLAFIGSINDEILEIQELAFKLLEFLLEYHKDTLLSRYNLETGFDKVLDVYDAIAVKRGLIKKGNEIDYERTARVIIDDFRKQRLGKIMLEYPNA